VLGASYSTLAIELQLRKRLRKTAEATRIWLRRNIRMATAAPYYHAQPALGEDLWRLAYGTACDAKDVALEVASQTVSVLQAFRMPFRVLGNAVSLRWDFSRLADRQGQLISRLQAATPDAWSCADCEKMTVLLDGLIAEERSMLGHAFSVSPVAKTWWARPLTRLQTQVDQLSVVAQYMDELSVPEQTLPGDEGCREFIRQFDSPEECDFSVEESHRKALSQA
jgi:hypothetical protein